MAEHEDEGQRDDEGQAAEDVPSAQFEMLGGRLNRKWSRCVFFPAGMFVQVIQRDLSGFWSKWKGRIFDEREGELVNDQLQQSQKDHG